jgi:nucleoid DNA-binding protein
MNKSDLIDEVSEVMRSKKDAKKAIDGMLSAISDALKKGDSVTLIGFGTFKVVERKARTGRNPQTGKKMKIKAKSVPKFVPGKALKDVVN